MKHAVTQWAQEKSQIVNQDPETDLRVHGELGVTSSLLIRLKNPGF
jgi:hypothetical protein